MDDELTLEDRPTSLVSVGCPACGVGVISPSLGPADLLDRHLRYCSWEPGED